MIKTITIFLLTGLIFFNLALVAYATTPPPYNLQYGADQNLSSSPYIDSQATDQNQNQNQNQTQCTPPKVLSNGTCITPKDYGNVNTYKMIYQIPCDQRFGNCPPASDPAGYVSRLYTFSLMAAGIVAMGALIFGAVKYILSAGNIVSQQDARDQMTSAIWGLMLLIGAYLILYTINPDLVNLRNPTTTPINLEDLSGGSGGGGGGNNNTPGSSTGGDSQCTAVNGTCLDSNTNQCLGPVMGWRTGLCAGAAARKCCAPTSSSSSGSGGSSSAPTQTGCKNNFSSGTVTISGKVYRMCMDCNYPTYENQDGVCIKK